MNAVLPQETPPVPLPLSASSGGTFAQIASVARRSGKLKDGRSAKARFVIISAPAVAFQLESGFLFPADDYGFGGIYIFGGP